MDKAFGSAVPAAPPIPRSKKPSARAALVGVQGPAQSVLSECFRQFGIESTVLGPDAPGRMQKEKFEACVVKLGPSASAVMESARTSPSNSRLVLYGLGGTIQEALRFSKYGVNAVFQEPLERPAVLKMMRSTQILVLHELRRYVRIPVITEVSVVTHDGRRFTARSVEVSSGGISMHTANDVAAGQPVEVSFALLTSPPIWVRGSVSWRNPGEKTFGIRFDPQDARRQHVKQWIDAYLES